MNAIVARITSFLAPYFARPDYVVHVLVGYAAMKLCLWATEAACLDLAEQLIVSGWVVRVMALLKERWDKAHPATHSAEGRDAYATDFGAALAATWWVWRHLWS